MNATPQTHKEATCLAFDASVVGASVALWHGGQVFSAIDAEPGRQAAKLVPMIEQALNEAGIWYDDVTRLVTTVGPGSFTGIRIGLSVAQGIVAARRMQVSVVTTLEAVALKSAEIHGDGDVWACLNAGKGEVYSQLFHVKQSFSNAASGILLLTPDAFANGITQNQRIVGNAEALLPGDARMLYHSGAELPDARHFVRASLSVVGPEALVPLYIRAPDAKLPASA